MGMMKNLTIEHAEEDREDMFNEDRYSIENDHKFMLFCGKYSELQSMKLHNREQMEIFGIIGSDFVCCRCRSTNNYGSIGELHGTGIFFCKKCLDSYKKCIS